MDQETIEFIRGSLQDGRSLEQIRWDLLSSGWRTVDADAAIAAATGKVPAAQPKNAPAPAVVPAKGRLPGPLYLAAAVILGAAYFYAAPLTTANWVLQYLIVLLFWAWIRRGDYYFGLGRGLAAAVLTGFSIFIIGLKLVTINFGCALLLALMGGRWQTEGKRGVAIVIIVVMTVWFIAGFFEPGARLSLI